MSEQQNTFVVMTDETGTKLQVQSGAVHIKDVNHKDVALATIDIKTQCPCTLGIEEPLPGVHSAFDMWVLGPVRI